MKFKHCRVCKGRMSSKFSYCPQCGGHNPKLGSWSAVVLVSLIGLAVLRFSDSYASSQYNSEQMAIRDTILIPVADNRY